MDMLEMQPLQNGKMDFPTELFQRVSTGHWSSLREFVSTEKKSFTDICQPNKANQDFTLLHYACNIADWNNATKAVQKVFEIVDSFDPQPKEKDVKAFINARDKNNKTAFQLAIALGLDDVMKILLSRKADVSMEVCQELLLKNTKYRSVLLQMFDQGIYLQRDQFDPSNQELWSVYSNFKQITGDSKRETKGLSTILYLGGVQRYKFMMNSLVQMFIDAKCGKYKYWIWFSMFFHIMWYLLIGLFLVGTTPNDTASQHTPSNLTSNSTEATVNKENTLDISWIVSSTWYMSIMYTVGFIALIKEIVEILLCPSKTFYVKQAENWGQWGLFAIAIVTAIVSLVGKLSYWLNVIVSIVYGVGIVVSLLLIQGQSSKTNLFGVNNQMLMKSLKKLLKFLGTFIVLLFAFAVILCTILPNASWNSIIIGFTTVLSRLTGELNMNDVFTEKTVQDPSFVIKAFFVYTLFIIVIVILFQNLWIGKTVSDIEELKNLGIAAHYASRLEVVNILESFFLKFSDSFVDKYSVLKEQAIKNEDWPLGIGEDFKFGIKFKHLPARTRKLIYKNVQLFPNGVNESDYEYF